MLDLQEQERKKYELVWTYDGYRTQADGDPVVELAYELMGCKPGESLIDWGCGKGTPAQKFQDKGLKVRGFDIAYNCLDKGVDIPLIVGCIWDPPIILGDADYSFSTDVLEHIPPAKLELAIRIIRNHTRKAAFLQVCTRPDSWGAKIDPPQVLHLAVMPPEEWQSMFSALWARVQPLNVGGKARSAFLCFKE